MKFPYILILSLIFCSALVYGQDGLLTAAADPAIVAAGEQFEVSFTFTGSEYNSAKNFKAPNFSQFAVVSGPNQSTNMQWINGKVSATISYNYVLYARQPGKYVIGSASIDYKNNTLRSGSIQIEVSQGKPKQQSQSDQSTAEAGDNIIVKTSVDKQRVKLGEQLVVTFKLYWRVSVTNSSLVKAPTFDGFWSEDFELPKQPVITTEKLDGKQYRCAVIKRTALFASQAGNLKIAPIEVRCAVQVQSKRRSNDPFDQFFNDPFFQQLQTVNMDVKSNPLTITVDPIPLNTPSGFSGSIGRFTFNASTDKHEVKAGDPITLKVSVSGSGNIKLVTLPKPELPADIESYDPKISEDITRDGGVIRGRKTAEYLLIPRNPGQRVVEPLKFVYYDLDKRDFVTLQSQRFEFSIAQGKEFTSSGMSLSSKEDIRILGEDIRFLKLDIGDLRHPNEGDSFWLRIFVLVIPPLIFGAALYYRKRREEIYGDIPKLLFETAGREATRRLKKARALMEQGNTVNYHAEILKSLMEYLEKKLRMPKAEFLLDDALLKLRRHGVKDEIVKSLKTCMERAEFARYAPASDTKNIRKELLDTAAGVINGIEQTFSKRGGS